MATQSGEVGEGNATPEMRELAIKKATCPFLGSAIIQGQLPVHMHLGNPLASVEDVVKLGNTGGGDLGKVLEFFARGNHGKMPGPTGDFNTPVPKDMFSLDLPGSQGSHPGHSGILQDDPTKLDSGRFSDKDFQRLVSKSRDGLIKRSDIASFIAENVERDPDSRSFPVGQLVRELADIFEAVVRRGRPDGDQDDAVKAEVLQSLTRIAGSNHLVGSAGEFGLLLAFLHNSPNTQLGKDPAFSMAEITAMFKDKKLPDGWENWKKTARDWVHHTIKLALDAMF